MKLLVTGGAGFIGSNFIIYWLKQHPNDSVVNLDALTYAGNLENLASVESNKNYTFVKGDIADRKVVAKVMKGIDIVVHFAAESHVDRSIADSTPFLHTNVVGTHVLLSESLKHNVQRFHHISTDEVFGSLSLDDQKRFDEATSYDPRSPYAASKASSDHLVRAFYHTHQLPITITNCSNNYGPYQFPEKLIPLAITNILEGKKVPVYGDGQNVRDWLYVTDHCRAIESVVLQGSIGQTYCVGGLTRDVSNLDVLRMIIQIMGASEDVIEFVTDRPGHDRRYAVNWDKIHQELDWSPEHSFEEYLEQTITWYSKEQDWWHHIKNGEYQTYYNNQYKGAVQ